MQKRNIDSMTFIPFNNFIIYIVNNLSLLFVSLDPSLWLWLYPLFILTTLYLSLMPVSFLFFMIPIHVHVPTTAHYHYHYHYHYHSSGRASIPQQICLPHAVQPNQLSCCSRPIDFPLQFSVLFNHLLILRAKFGHLFYQWNCRHALVTSSFTLSTLHSRQ